MKVTSRIQRAIVLAAYGAFVLAPLAHSLAHGSHTGQVRCCDDHKSGPLFVPDCDDSCNDPAHHHHPHLVPCCVACQVHRSLVSTMPTTAATLSFQESGQASRPVDVPPIRSLLTSANVTRGPPPATFN